MRKNTIIILLIAFLMTFQSLISKEDLKINIGAYVDTYIATDNDKQPFPWDSTPGTKLRKLTTSDAYKDEFALNIAQISANISYGSKVRSLLVLQTGTLPETGFGNFKPNIQQANVGINLFNDIWLDAGYFLTHIGGESYLPKDNWLSTHSLVTIFEPFYQSGVKIAYEGKSLSACLHILNGNNIFEDNNANKSIGLFLAYQSDKAFKISYAGIFGNEGAGKISQTKFHVMHNLCVEAHPSDKIGFKAQFDYATLEKGTFDDKGKPADGVFMGFSAQSQYKFTNEFSGTVRFSYISNSDGIYNGGLNGFDGMAITGGIEYKPTETSYIRLESRMISLNEGEEKAGYPGKIFFDGKEKVNSRAEVMLNFGVWFE
jgi:hypothetical protein